MSVLSSTLPGPKRWKLWIAALSCTSMSYVPAGRDVTLFPSASVSVIV
jgi:hypothetical protein